MRFRKHIFYIIIIATFASCSSKPSSNDNATITVNGRLFANLTPMYTYGTNTLVVSGTTSYYVEGTSLTIASYVNDSVQAVLKDVGIRQSPGPELYNVIQITVLR